MLLLFDLFLQISKLVLKRHHDFLRDFFLLFKLLLTGDLLLSPPFKFLAHGIDIISYEVDRLSERIGRLTKYLDSLLHELGILFSEALAT